MDNKGVSLSTEEGLWLLIKVGLFLTILIFMGSFLLSPDKGCDSYDRNPAMCIENERCEPVIEVYVPSVSFNPIDMINPSRKETAYSGCTDAVRRPNHFGNCAEINSNCVCAGWNWQVDDKLKFEDIYLPFKSNTNERLDAFFKCINTSEVDEAVDKLHEEEGMSIEHAKTQVQKYKGTCMYGENDEDRIENLASDNAWKYTLPCNYE